MSNHNRDYCIDKRYFIFLLSFMIFSSVIVSSIAVNQRAYGQTCSVLPISSVTAKGSQSGNPPGNAIDGNVNTRWSNLGLGSWITVDLGDKKTVCSVGINWYRGNERVYTFTVSTSSDGSNFVNVFSGKSGKVLSEEVYDFADQTARYVKITVNENTQNDWISISELKVYGFAQTDDGDDTTCSVLPISSVTAKGSQSGNPPGNAIDGNTQSRWANSGSGSWIKPNLGSVKKICEVGITWYLGNQRVYNFNIAVSNDDKSYVTVFSGKSKGNTASEERYGVGDTDARYVRITVNGNSQNDWASINEIKVYGNSGGSGGDTSHAPVAQNQAVTVTMSTDKSIKLVATDVDGDSLSYQIVSQPTHGIQKGSPPDVIYTPNSGYVGTDSFEFKANDGKTDSNVAVVSINVVSSGDSSDVDKFGIKKLFTTKSGGEEWYINMVNPDSDPQFDPQDKITKNSDGSWKMKSSQVRMGVFTSAGYDRNEIQTLDHSKLAQKGYMQSTKDWTNIEMTGYFKVNSAGSDDNFAPYGRGGRHTGGGSPEGCEGSSLKGDVYFSGRVRFAKEQWHVSYVYAADKSATTSIKGKWIGIKFVVYNFPSAPDKTAVKLETWLDINNNGNFVKVDETTDKGGWGREDGECNGAPDQIITWGGPIATFRWDTATDVDFKNLSVREIQPPA